MSRENEDLLRCLDAWREGENPGPLIRWAAAHLRGCLATDGWAERHDWWDRILVGLAAGTSGWTPKVDDPDPRCDCTVIKRPHSLRDHYVPEPGS